MHNRLSKLQNEIRSRLAGFDCDYQGSMIYHYTSPGGLLGILKKTHPITLFFTRYDSLNDIKERQDILDSLAAYCRKKQAEGAFSPEFFRDVLAVKPSDNVWISHDEKETANGSEAFQNIPCDTYLCCFSEVPDHLPMWNYYTKTTRCEGYCIGFDREMLVHREAVGKGYSLQLKKVIYDDAEKTAFFDSFLPQLFPLYQEGVEEEQKAILQMVQTVLSDFQFVFKNESFRHENEVRGILQLPKGGFSAGNDLPEVNFRNSNGYIVPYVEYSVDKHAVQQVVVGPLLDQEIAVRNLNEMLLINGYRDVDVLESKVPIRF